MMLEATCGRCGETFVPADENDLEHGVREDGTACGGTGVIDGAWIAPDVSRDQRARKSAALHNATGIPGATVAFRATLVGTSNAYLAEGLPRTGLVRIHERDVYGRPMMLTFLPDPMHANGPTSWVEIADAELAFGTLRDGSSGVRS